MTAPHPIEETLGHTFTDKALLQTALTHPSVTHESKGRTENNQRLEFLGDAVFQLTLSRHLYDNFPNFAEGKLTQLRSRLVCGKTFTEIARRHQFGQYLILSKAEESNQGRTKPGALADLMEALIGAIYLDAGLEKTQDTILKLIDPILQEALSNNEEPNPKGRLQEILQDLAPLAPVYNIVKEEGPPHNRIFTSVVRWQERELGQGSGASKQAAEAQAAQKALNERAWL